MRTRQLENRPVHQVENSDVRSRNVTARNTAGLALAVLSGLAMACQGRINGQLGAGLHDSMLAAVISFGGGLLILLAMLPFVPKMRAGVGNVVTALRAGRLRPWQCLGGIGGASFVAAQSITVAVLGVAMFTVGVVAGQTLSGLLADRAGLGPAGPRPLTVARIVGAVLTLGGVAGALSGGATVSGGRLWLPALPMIAGALMAVQQAVNGRVGASAGSALTAALGNFLVGTTVLVVGWLISLVVRGGPTGWPHNPVLYLGGLVGIVFIAVGALVVEWIGVLLLGLAAIAGQLIGSVLVDLLLPTDSGRLAGSTVVGVAVSLVAVGIATVGDRRRRPGANR